MIEKTATEKDKLTEKTFSSQRVRKANNASATPVASAAAVHKPMRATGRIRLDA